MSFVGVGCVLSAACTAKGILDWICDHLDKLKEAKKIVKRILEFIEYMQSELTKMEIYTKDDYHDADATATNDDVKVRAEAYLEGFLVHLKSVKSSLESSESERNRKGAVNEAKKFLKVRTVVDNLLAIEDELKLAMDKLQLFIGVLTLKVTCESRDLASENTHLLNEISDEIKAVAQQNQADVGIEYIQDSAVKRPSAPHEFAIREGKNTFILSWKPCSEEIDKYELCYHESRNRACFIDRTKCSVEIGAPKVKPCPKNLPYTMKIRGICGSVKGEWSNIVVGQFTKPLPQKPKIKKLFLRSTIAEITATITTICSTESPVTCWQVAYIIDTSTEWSHREFKVDTNEGDHTFDIHNLEPKRKYTFKVKAMNAEGWGEFSHEISSSTNKLPPSIAKPSPPLIEALSRTMVKITVESPEGANFMAPIILWQVTAIYFDCSARKEAVKKAIFKPSYAKECSSFNIVDLAPNQQYNFKVIAKNERGWSPSSDTVIAFTGPSLPSTIRPSSFKSASLIKIRWELSSKYTRPSCYEIIKKTKGDKGREYEIQRNIPGDKSSAFFTNLNNNTTYYFKLRSWNGLYTSEWSEEIRVKTDRIPVRKKFSSRSSKSVADNESDSSNTMAIIEEVLIAKAAELSDQSDDEDPVIISS